MGRKPASRGLAAGAVLLSWVAAASLAEGLFGADIGQAVRRLDQRIEQQLERGGCPRSGDPQDQPERSHEDEPIESWELVSV